MLHGTYRKLALLIAMFAIAAATLGGAACGDSKKDVILATTTSTQDSGLLDVLVPAFEEQSAYHVKVIAVGTGEALKMGERGDADVLLVHAPSSEQEFMDAGNGVNRQLVMHNDYVIVGPENDPAQIRSAAGAHAAMQAIADAKSPFISRGDDSGTNKFELKLWKDLNIDPKGLDNYEETGQGMGATLQVADQKNAYTISDRGTYLAYEDKVALVIDFENDPPLLNVYHVIEVNPDKFDNLNVEGAKAFAAFMVAPATQELIGTFGVDKYGQALFTPDAGKSEADVGLQ
jgi:tungstate transport system substrate-binding protein